MARQPAVSSVAGISEAVTVDTAVAATATDGLHLDGSASVDPSQAAPPISGTSLNPGVDHSEWATPRITSPSGSSTSGRLHWSVSTGYTSISNAADSRSTRGSLAAGIAAGLACSIILLILFLVWRKRRRRQQPIRFRWHDTDQVSVFPIQDISPPMHQSRPSPAPPIPKQRLPQNPPPSDPHIKNDVGVLSADMHADTFTTGSPHLVVVSSTRLDTTEREVRELRNLVADLQAERSRHGTAGLSHRRDSSASGRTSPPDYASI
ncbi:hypothetical protein D9619_005156 [Psilocybe cf. subviscida]|uniref:Uncharacterized protein n=1 Tax=Psilocybe cf. subviscida TaxID=2480587 RepID=A0A8H5BQ67_9AGAR|nr:hypothetical protein D9619_005156 [Psilocybe cf. subviscida]